MARAATPKKRQRGSITTLPSGSLRVMVYAGKDAVTKKRHYLTEVVPAGPNAAEEAEQARTRLLNRLDERRSPRTGATVNLLLDKHFDKLADKVESTTLEGYHSLANTHIRPLIGEDALKRVDGEHQDSFYQELRRCRVHCDGRPFVEHRTEKNHKCDAKCRPHECRPLGRASIRKIKSILNGAGERAFRWGWIGYNPFALAEKLPTPKANPSAPTNEQAAAILNEAFREDVMWGMFLWLLMVTGARRGEQCAETWGRLDFKNKSLALTAAIGQRGKRTWEKDLKTHQQRRVALDDNTIKLLIAFQVYCAERAGFGSEMPPDARIFSLSIDGSTWIKPDTASQRFKRMCARLGWNMNIHDLRHYSATELITAGVDIRTVAGRLGHSGGGAITLRFYSAWVSEADQRAAGTLTGRMPELPQVLNEEGTLVAVPVEKAEDDSPYKRIAADLRGAIVSGVLGPGDQLPTVSVLAERYQVSFGTAQRAIAQLRMAGLVNVRRGRRAVVVDPAVVAESKPADVINLR